MSFCVCASRSVIGIIGGFSSFSLFFLVLATAIKKREKGGGWSVNFIVYIIPRSPALVTTLANSA